VAGGAVAVRDGAILAAGPAAEVAAAHPDLPETDLGAAILMPGLVDAHTHLEWSLTGGLVQPGPFAPWVGGLIALRGRMSAEDHRVAAAYGARHCLAAGTTTLADSGPTGAGARAMAEAGLRGAVHLEIFGAPEGAAAEAAAAGLAERIAALEAEAGPRVAVGVSPHAPYTVGPDLWAALAARPDLADRPWASHLAESPAESRLLATGDGPLAELFARMGFAPGRWPGPDGASPVARLAAAGALRRGLVAAHAVQLDRRDPRLLAEAGVAVAHCPTSNAYLECGRAPVAALAGAGVRIGLGTDSPGSGGGYDLRAEARACALVHAASPLGAPPPESLVRLMTLGGAAALGMDDAIGSLEPGKRADLLVLRPGPAGAGGDPHLAALDPAAAVDAVLVDGEPLVWRGEPVRGDGDRLDARAREVRARLC
jgi:5-methylthioadenosine/S-adenosylhomocysteine deaminase